MSQKVKGEHKLNDSTLMGIRLKSFPADGKLFARSKFARQAL